MRPDELAALRRAYADAADASHESFVSLRAVMADPNADAIDRANARRARAAARSAVLDLGRDLDRALRASRRSAYRGA